MNIGGYVKDHPWTVGAIVVGGGLAFVVLSGWFTNGSGQVVVAGSSGPSDAQLASSTNLALQQISAGVATNQTSAELAATKIQADLAGNVAQLQYQLGIHNTDAGEDVSLANVSAQLQAILSGNATQMGINANNNATSVAINTLSAGIQGQQITANSNIMSKLIDALTPKPPATPDPIPTVTNVTSPQPATNVWDQYLIDNPDVAKAYPEYLANQATWATAGVHTGDTIEQFAQDHYTITGATEGRTLRAS